MLLLPDPPAASLAPSRDCRVRNARPRQGRREGQRGRTATRPRPRPAAPLLAPARPCQGCPQHVRRSDPALRQLLPPLVSLPAPVPDWLRHRRRPFPLPAASSSAGLAVSCRVLSAPPNLAPSLPQEPPFESAHAALNPIGCGDRTRRSGGGAGRARAAEGGAGELEAGTGTCGSRGTSPESGNEPGARGWGRGWGMRAELSQDPERAKRRTARGLLGEPVPALAEERVRKRCSSGSGSGRWNCPAAPNCLG